MSLVSCIFFLCEPLAVPPRERSFTPPQLSHREQAVADSVEAATRRGLLYPYFSPLLHPVVVVRSVPCMLHAANYVCLQLAFDTQTQRSNDFASLHLYVDLERSRPGI